jgi:Baseplate J-like protein
MPEGTAGEPTPLTLVYLDVDDEITSAAARIRGAGADRVALVLPYGSRLATSRINFRLLAREATERGKQIEIICADASARALAAAAGLPVHPSVAAFEGRVPAGAAGGSAPDAGEGALGAGAATGIAAGADLAEVDPDDTQTRVLALPRRSSPRVPIVGPPRPPVRPRVAVALGLLIVVLIGVGALLAVELLPSATIVLHPRSEGIGPLEFTVEARPDVAAPDANGLVIPAQLITFSLQASDTFTATGVKNVETKATGSVTFANFDTGRGVVIPARTVVKTASNIEFLTLAEITLPRATFDFFPPFKVHPSTGDVTIEAALAGAAGNVSNNSITEIAKAKNTLTVTNEQATSGGEQRQATEVSAQDVESAKAAIDAALATELDDQLGAGTGVPAELTMFPETLAVGDSVYVVDPATLVGTEATQFDLAATAEGSALGVDPSPIAAIAESRLESRVKAGWTLVPGTTPTIGTPTAFGEVATYPVTISGAQVRDVDQAALLASIEGLVLADARARLADYGDVEITLWPDWVSKVPAQADRVTFTIGDPQPSAAP